MNEMIMTANAIAVAQEALNQFKANDSEKYTVKGKTMMEQVANYIYDKLVACGWMCDGFQTNQDVYKALIFDHCFNRFCFYCGHSNVYIVLSKNKGIEIHCGKNVTPTALKTAMEIIASEWGCFKIKFDKMIKNAMQGRINQLQKEMEHLNTQNAIIDAWEL